MNMDFNPNWTDLIVLVVSWLMGALGIGLPRVTPSRLMNKNDE